MDRDGRRMLAQAQSQVLRGVQVFLPAEYENGDAGSSSPGLRIFGMCLVYQVTAG